MTLTPANAPAAIGGGGQSFTNMQPSLALNYYMALSGVYPSPSGGTIAGGDAQPYLGQIIITASTLAAPAGFAPLDGQLLPINQNEALFSILGTTYGGDGVNTFALPDLRGRTPVGVGTGLGLTPRVLGESFGTESTTLTTINYPPPTGNNFSYSNMQPSLALHYIIAQEGLYPQANGSDTDQDVPLLGQIALFAGNTAPSGWAQLLPINVNQALFSILGTTYGGDGTTDFALPDLDGRTIVGTDGNDWLPGTEAGVETLPVSPSELPVPEPASTGILIVGLMLMPRRRSVIR